MLTQKPQLTLAAVKAIAQAAEAGGDDDARAGGPEAKGYKSLNFNAAGTNFPVIQDIIKHVVEKGKSLAAKEKVGENLYNRGVYNSMLVAEGIRNAQKITGKKAVVLGSNNSAHDICAALWEHGADVTMLQRSSTHIAPSDSLMELALGGLYSEEAVQNGIDHHKADLVFASVLSCRTQRSPTKPNLAAFAAARDRKSTRLNSSH